jgi:hypothetical protein
MLKTRFGWALSVSILLASLSLLPTATSQSAPNSQIHVEGRSGVAQQPAGKWDRSGITVDAVMESHIRFLGGRAAIERQTSFVIKGTFESGIGLARITLYAKAPNKFLEVVDWPNGTQNKMGADGTVAWNEDPEGKIHKAAGRELKIAMAEADFRQSLHMHELYPQLILKGQEMVEGHSAYVLEADLGDGYLDRLYVATQSGELLRTDREIPTKVVSRFYYNWRDINGVQFPFTEREESPIGDVFYRFDEIRANVPIEDSLFSAPSSANRHKNVWCLEPECWPVAS